MESKPRPHLPEAHHYLSAPWRMRYLSHGSRSDGCVFCTKLAANDDVENLIVWRGESIAILMNLYPYSTGHLMIMPYEHVASPEELVDSAVLNELAQAIPTTMRAMRRVLRCQGFNTGMNTGSVGGAGIADHMHMHLVPRWEGDANFMPIVANTTVMPEALSVTYAKLRAELIVEHDGARLPSALVFSEDRSRVLLLDEEGGVLPSPSTVDDTPLVVAMGRQLADLGIDAAVTGWTGDDTVVWQATGNPNASGGRWVPVAEVPSSIVPLVAEALARMQSPEE